MIDLVNKLVYMLQFLPIMAVGFVAAYSITPLTKRVALRWEIIDQPNRRKIHEEPIPLLGGLAIYAAFLVAMLLFAPAAHLAEFGAVLAGSLWLAIVGYVDDRNGMRPIVKLSAQLLASMAVMFAGIHVQLFEWPILDYALTLFWIVGIINAVNFMDNMDGLAAGISAISAGTFFILAVSQELILVTSLSAALCGATLGFLRYNFNPASIFMGDIGSLVIGFLLGVLGIKLDFQAQTRFVTWIIPVLVLGIPIFDTTLVTFTRLREKRSPMQGGKDHTSHRLVNLGLTHRQAVLSMYAVAVLLGISTLFISQAAVVIAAGLMITIALLAAMAFAALEISYMRGQ